MFSRILTFIKTVKLYLNIIYGSLKHIHRNKISINMTGDNMWLTGGNVWYTQYFSMQFGISYVNNVLDAFLDWIVWWFINAKYIFVYVASLKNLFFCQVN